MVTEAYKVDILRADEIIPMVFDVSGEPALAHANSRIPDLRSIQLKKHPRTF